MRSLLYPLSLLLIFSLFLFNANAQVCTGSLGDPVINQDFGAGPNPGAPLKSGITDMAYTTDNTPNDGFYTIANSLVGSAKRFSAWQDVPHDHTGNPNGYMMIINASFAPSIFFTQTATGLCPSTTYEFSSYVLNLITLESSGPTVIEPNIVFTIESTSGKIIASDTIGNIPNTKRDSLYWKKCGVYFTTPADVSDVVVKMSNLAPGGNGNDLILDDITFRACGPIIQTGFSSTTGLNTQQLCQGASATYNLKASVTGNNSPSYQWQSNISNAGWQDIPSQNTDSLTVSIVNAVAGQYQYRLGVANGSNISNIPCRVYSPPLIVNVHAPPVVPTIAVKSVCLCTNYKTDEFCPGDSLQFADTTNPADASVTSWLWDFGDNTSSASANPIHFYANPGIYNVTLTVGNTYGCISATLKTLKINYKPIAAFSMSTIDCSGVNVTFTDNSTIGKGNIAKWLWDYGDGKSDTFTNNLPVNHIYVNPGDYTVKLTVISESGCSSTESIQILTINPLPVVDFSLPAVCLSDSYAHFTDLSTIANDPAPDFTYSWDFGDPNATPTNPNTSILKNPFHKYSQANNYNVTLTVTSAKGCVFTKTQVFTVNGDTPIANFAVENKNNLCSSDPVVFDNLSSVNFGSITKIKWFFDFNNNPTDTVVFLKDNIPADNKFYHNYGLFNSPLTKTYNIRMEVYSGITCTNVSQQNIMINANPIVNLSTIGTVCENVQPIQIIENKNGFTGTGVFSGKGVSSTGLFKPLIAGAGTFNIDYVFTDQNGCSFSSSQSVTVLPIPSLSLVTDMVLLEGGVITLPAVADGDNLTYKWTPSIGLSADNVLNPIANPTENTIYSLVVTNSEGCSVGAEVSVSVLKFPTIPNTFTPNGDGINDTWNIKYLNEYQNCTISIFNRYGEKVYFSNGYNIPWDGKYGGADLPQGTYYYIISPGNGRKVLTGNVTIIR